jgi:hypothetical protein
MRFRGEMAMASSSIVCFAPKHNTDGKHDATGAFQPEMHAFAKHWSRYGVDEALIDNERSADIMRKAVIAELQQHRQQKCIAFFCHGWKGGIQLGFRLYMVETFAAALGSAISATGCVVLYACDAGRDSDNESNDDLLPGPGGEGGFADELRDALCRARTDWVGHVDAHVSTAHTTRNPHVRRFTAGGTSEYLIRADSPLWPAWKRALKGDLRFRFPLMSRSDIEVELKAPM